MPDQSDFDKAAADLQINAPTPSAPPVAGEHTPAQFDQAVTDTLNADPLEQAARINLKHGLTLDPTAAVKALGLAQQTGLPAPLVQRNLPEVQQRYQFENLTGLLNQHPILRNQVATDPSFAGVAHDDLHNLANLEQTAKGPSLSPLPDTWLQRARDWLGQHLGVWEAQRARAINELAAQNNGMTIDQARAAVGGMRPVEKNIVPFGEQFIAKGLNTGSFGLIPDFAGEPQTTAGVLGGIGGDTAGFIFGGPVRAAEWMVGRLGLKALEHVGGESFAKAITKDITTGALKLGTATSLADFGNALNSPDVQTFAEKEAQSFLHGAEAGGVFGLFGRLLPDNTAVQTLARITGVSTVLDYLNGTSPVQTIRNWDTYTPQEKVSVAANYLINAWFSKQGAGRAQGGWVRDAVHAEAASAAQHKVDELSKIAQASTLRTRAPEQFKAVAEKMLGENTDTVYVPVQAADTFFQSHPDALQTMQQRMPDAFKSYQEAQTTGGDVAIPTADYLTHLTEYHQELRDHVKLHPEDMTPTEAQQWGTQAAEQFDTEAQQILAQHAQDVTFQRSADQVYNNVRDQINATGRFAAGVADKYAALHQAFAVTMADRLGIEPAQVYERYGLKVQGQGLTTDNAAPDANTLDQPKRGSINLSNFPHDPATVTLLEKADLSTFLHESGHFFLESLTHVAAQPDAPAQTSTDLHTLLQWFGVKDAATWHAMSPEQRRSAHEQFARGFEAYLFEGKAPTPALQGVFAHFRAWLLHVYHNLRGLNVTLTPQVREVFDRLLATDAEIQAAHAAEHLTGLFSSAEQAGMTPSEWADYQALGQAAAEHAHAELQQKSLRDMRWLDRQKTQALKGFKREAAAKRRAVRAEVTDLVLAEPVYRVGHFLSRGTLPDGTTPEGLAGVKLALDALKTQYGTAEDALWRRLPTRGRYAMTTAGEHGVAPELIAELFGFGSGDELVRKLAEAPPVDQVIEARTDQTMLERYGDIATPAALERAAQAAVHNDARQRFVHTELNALSRQLGSRTMLAHAARDYAERVTAQKPVRDAIKATPYRLAEVRAARQAEQALARGDRAQAAHEKRAQLLNSYLFRAADRAATEVDKILHFLQKFDRVGVRKNVDPEYLDQIDTLLERFDLRRSVTNKALAKRKSLQQWIEAQQAQGFEPVIDARLLADASKQHYKEMPLEEFRGLYDAVKNIDHLGRLKNQLLTAKDHRDLEMAVTDAADAILTHAKQVRKSSIETRLPGDRAAQLAGEFFASHRKMASLVRELDGFQDGGIVWDLLMRPLNAASDNEAVRNEQATLALGKIFEHYSAKDLAKMYHKEYLPAIDQSLTKMGRLMVALNWGNADNRARIRDGYKWTDAQVQAVLDTLDKRDWDFVQAVWDHLESYWPQIADKEQRITGVVPQKVEASAVETKYGTVRGGYFPIKYDDRQSPRAYADAAKEAAEQAIRGRYSRAQTRRGHTKARVETVNRPVRLDFGVIFEHVGQVVHDLALHEYLIDANRLLGHKTLQRAILDTLGPDAYKQLQATVTDVAAGNVPAMQAFERGINWLRTGSSVAALGWNFGTALLQPLGLTQSMVRIGPKWVGRGLSRWLRDASSMENTAQWIHERSAFMRLRGKTMQREINEIRNRITEQSPRRRLLGKAEESYFWLITKAQAIADIPTWLGAYEKAMATDPTMSEDRAVALADQAVIDAQGGGQVKDLAAIQRGGPLMKLWTNFYSFFSTTYNLTAESIKRTDFRDPASVGRLGVDLFLLYSLPAVLGLAVHGSLHCDSTADCAKRIGSEQLSYLMSTMVGLRELGSAIDGYYQYSGPAGARGFSVVNRLAQQVSQGKLDTGLLKTANQAGGILFHYPALEVQRIVDGFVAMNEGKTHNPLSLLLGAPKK